MTNILVAEDERRIASFVAKGLRANGFGVTIVSDGPSALEQALSGEFDLMILDIGLPGLDGFSVLSRLRSSGSTLPVVILTARNSTGDRVAGLDGGADDYMSKPFRFDELLARVRLRLRDSVAEALVLRAGDLSLDLRSRRASLGGQEIELTSREFVLAETLVRHAGQVLSRDELLRQVWGYDFDPGSNIVDVYVRYLRQKLGAERIATVRGRGYRFVASPGHEET